MITEMTENQVKMMDVYCNKWIDLGLSTSKFNQEEEATKIIYDLYKIILNKTEMPKVIIKESPLAAWNYIQEVCGKKMNFVWPYFSGSYDVNIFAFYDYCITELGIKIEDELLKKYNAWKATHNLGLIFPFDDKCIVTEKPIEIHRKGNVLHNETGPAIRYSDGFSVYILNGVRMIKEYVETPWDKLDAKIIIKEKNAEVRRELVRKIGIERVVENLGAKVIDVEGDYELLLLNIGDKVDRPYLKMKNPSIGVYHIEGVSPECRTVKDAIKFRNGSDEKPSVLT